MPNNDTPAENAGGGTPTSSAAPSSLVPEELPDKLRVHALAKLLGTSSREILGALTSLGEPPRSVQSNVPKQLALRVASSFPDPAGAGEGRGDPPGATSSPVEAPSTEPPPARRAPEAPRFTPHDSVATEPSGQQPAEREPGERSARPAAAPVFAAPSAVFRPPEQAEKPQQNRTAKREQEQSRGEPAAGSEESGTAAAEPDRQQHGGPGGDAGQENPEDDDESGAARRRRRRGRRGRGRGKGGAEDEITGEEQHSGAAEGGTSNGGAASQQDAARDGDGANASGESSEGGKDDGGKDGETSGGARRRRRRRRRKDSGDSSNGEAEVDPPNTVVHVRDGRERGSSGDSGGSGGSGGSGSEQVRSVRGSTRLEAKRQRRRDGRDAGRKRVPVVSEAEFLARRESVRRTMVVRERGEHVQIGVLEDDVLVEHFVTSHGSGSLVGNVYLGRVQNVLPSMEAAFVDIGRGRNAVLYAGEVDWDAAGLEGKARKIEQALSTGDSVLVQVTKDPVGHKGARLTTQISLPGRFLVYVPGGGATGISRKLPDTERKRLKEILKRVVPSDAGVIVRTASEGIGEDELDGDVRRLQKQWETISERSKGQRTKAPELLYSEPDLLIKVVRDLFTEDFAELVVSGDGSFSTIESYVDDVAPDLRERLKRHTGSTDVFTEYRVDEQIAKALDRKVWLPSGGTLVIDRTEAMTVVDVNTGKFTGSGGNLEETVTKNNLESAEEIVRQLRLRDIGGIIVIDFIDMVLESNRDLVLRRLTECLGRDRTRHQVAEVTSLGLVQMTRKRLGTGLLEAFSSQCEHCRGRGVVVTTEPVAGQSGSGSGSGSGNGSGSGSGNGHGSGSGSGNGSRKGRNRSKGGESSSNASGGKRDSATKEDDEAATKAAQRIAAASLIHAKSTEQAPQHDIESGAGEAVGPEGTPASAVPPPVTDPEAGSRPAAAALANDAPATAPEGSSSTQAPAASSATTEVEPGRVATGRRRRAVSRPAGPPAGNAASSGEQGPGGA